MTKLDSWAEDIKTSLELELRIWIRKSNLERLKPRNDKTEDKVSVQRQIKDMEKRRNE